MFNGKKIQEDLNNRLLQAAIVKGDDLTRIIKLIELGADVNSKDVMGYSVLKRAKIGLNFNIMKLLKNNGAIE